jgi:hypothetical protein
MDQVPLYVLSMTLVPHHVATRSWGINSQTGVMFVGRVQGVRDRVEEMRTATKALKDIAPPRILLCAVEALATTLGADIIAGVSNAEQLERRRQGDKHDTFLTTTRSGNRSAPSRPPAVCSAPRRSYRKSRLKDPAKAPLAPFPSATSAKQ